MEIVDDSGNKPVLTGELAEKLGLAQPTCSRILKDLVEMGFLDQAENQKGFVLGERIRQMGVEPPLFKQLKEVADNHVKRCSEETKASVVLLSDNNFKRYILLHHNGNPDLEITFKEDSEDDFYTYATGRTLLAWKSQKHILEQVKRAGLPGQEWPEISTTDKLLSELEKIKQDGYIFLDRNSIFIIAYPVFQNGEIAAAVGCSAVNSEYNKKRFDLIKTSVEKMAQRITEDLNE